MLSDDLWNPDERLQVDPASSPERIEPQHPTVADGFDVLPDSVLRQYPGLDDESRSFLRFGPRGAHERLAYAQGVDPRAHAFARLAPSRNQRVFEERGVFDASRSFVGPDGHVYLRDEATNEMLGARIRRGYERVVGGFNVPTVAGSLREIRENTRSKRADVQSAWPQPSSNEELRRAYLRSQRVNPSTWTLAAPLDETAQETFRESGELWPAIAPFAFVGPDGVVYRRNEAVREDPFSQYRRVREWQEAQQRSAAAPPPDPWELYWQAVAAGAVLPGPIHGRAMPPTRWNPAKPVVPPVETRFGGRLGSKETRELNERIAEGIAKSGRKRYYGPLRPDGSHLREERIPGPLAGFEMDSRKGSLYPDISFELPNGKFIRINTMTINPRTGKPTAQEYEALLRIFMRTEGDVYGIPKVHQLRNLKKHELD
ncbi:MAG: hypothetical protein ACREEE_07595 [Dongiaceae bacterium]